VWAECRAKGNRTAKMHVSGKFTYLFLYTTIPAKRQSNFALYAFHCICARAVYFGMNLKEKLSVSCGLVVNDLFKMFSFLYIFVTATGVQYNQYLPYF